MSALLRDERRREALMCFPPFEVIRSMKDARIEECIFQISAA